MRIAALLMYAIGLAIVWLGQDAHAQTVDDPVEAISGRWQIIDLRTSEISGGFSCENPQVFTPTSDRRHVDLEYFYDGAARRTRYIVLHARAGQFLGFIEGETRVTNIGDPVIWWAVFSNPNRFRWRRYDWGADNLTLTEWRRCD